MLNLSRASRYAVLRTLDRPARDAVGKGQSSTTKEKYTMNDLPWEIAKIIRSEEHTSELQSH